MLIVTLASGGKEIVKIPKKDELPPFISNDDREIHYRLKLKKLLLPPENATEGYSS